MEINNSPSISLIPVILGEKAAVQTRAVEKNALSNPADSASARSQQVSRVISETDRASARRQFEAGTTEKDAQSLVRDQSASTNKAISAYVETEQAEQRNYLSDVLGIDVYT